jgi:hypothetical protein
MREEALEVLADEPVQDGLGRATRKVWGRKEGHDPSRNARSRAGLATLDFTAKEQSVG